MSHKKEIYTCVIKPLPHINLFIERQTNIHDFNALCAAFYELFDSDTLTKKDYLHILGVLQEKFPIYEHSLDTEKYKSVSVTYAAFNYPPNPDIKRVIERFIDSATAIAPALLSRSIYKVRARMEECSDFVGIELHKQGFTREPMSEKDLETIKKIILV